MKDVKGAYETAKVDDWHCYGVIIILPIHPSLFGKG
jgi:hypothetical protein